MNAYLIQEDGADPGVFIADTMDDALHKAFKCCQQECEGAFVKVTYNEWMRDVQSCALLGEVKEPTP